MLKEEKKRKRRERVRKYHSSKTITSLYENPNSFIYKEIKEKGKYIPPPLSPGQTKSEYKEQEKKKWLDFYTSAKFDRKEYERKISRTVKIVRKGSSWYTKKANPYDKEKIIIFLEKKKEKIKENYKRIVLTIYLLRCLNKKQIKRSKKEMIDASVITERKEMIIKLRKAKRVQERRLKYVVDRLNLAKLGPTARLQIYKFPLGDGELFEAYDNMKIRKQRRNAKLRMKSFTRI